jgi:hypothetical protein
MLNLITLESRKITAKLKVERAIKTASQQGLGKKIFSKLAQFANWAFSKIITTFNIDFDRIWDMCVDAYYVLKDFDFNQTDKELQQQIEQNNNAIAVAGARALGEQVGIGTVRLVTAFAGKFLPGKKGAALKSTEGIKIPVLSKRIALALAEEQGNQLRSDTIQFLETAGRAMTSNALINVVLFTRKYELLGAKPITQEIEANGSIAAKVEKEIKKLPKQFQEPTAAFLDGIEQGIITAGYVVAGTLDDDVAALRHVFKEQRGGETITVEATTEDGEKLTFVGDRENVKEAMQTALPLAPLLGKSQSTGIPQTWALKPGIDRPQLVITYKHKSGYHSFSIPHYSGPRTPDLPTFQTGSWCGFWVLRDGSKLCVYASSRQEALRTLGKWGKYVEGRMKAGTKPVAKETTRTIRRKQLAPLSADFYAKGPGEGITWRAYLK